MPDTYVPVNQHHANVVVPLPGELVRTDGITPAIKRAADNAEYALSHVAQYVFDGDGSTFFATSSSTYVTTDAVSGFVEIDVITGDTVLPQLFTVATIQLNSAGSWIALHVADGSAFTGTIPGAEWHAASDASGNDRPLAIMAPYTAQADGTLHIAAKAKATDGTISFVRQFALSVTRIRP